MKIIDLQLQSALRKMKTQCGNNAELGRTLCLSRAQIGKYLDGTTRYIDDKTWVRIEPLLTPYLQSSPAGISAKSGETCLLTVPNSTVRRIVEVLAELPESRQAAILSSLLAELEK